MPLSVWRNILFLFNILQPKKYGNSLTKLTHFHLSNDKFNIFLFLYSMQHHLAHSNWRKTIYIYWTNNRAIFQEKAMRLFFVWRSLHEQQKQHQTCVIRSWTRFQFQNIKKILNMTMGKHKSRRFVHSWKRKYDFHCFFNRKLCLMAYDSLNSTVWVGGGGN